MNTCDSNDSVSIMDLNDSYARRINALPLTLASGGRKSPLQDWLKTILDLGMREKQLQG
jgi:hypothetical protein